MKNGSHAAHHEDHTKAYLAVFGSLLVLTLVTVGASYLHLPRVPAIAVGLLIACVKGSLVGAFFMHLVSERTLIRSILVLSFFMLALLLLLPLSDIHFSAGQSTQSAEAAPHGHHEASHVP